MAATVVLTNPNRSNFYPAAVSAPTPYGLPIVDKCTTCKLRAAGFFCALGAESLEALDKIKHPNAYPKDALVFVEGQTARGIFVVCQGRVKVSTTSRDGKTLILKIAGPGEILGLHSVIRNNPHEVTAETMQPSQLAFIAREDFLNFLKGHGDACLQAAYLLSRECQSAYDSIRSIGLSHSVTEKLAHLIQQWISGSKALDGVIRARVTLTHEEIGQLSGTSRETVTRVLGELKRKGIAELKGSTLVVRNPAALAALAGG